MFLTIYISWITCTYLFVKKSFVKTLKIEFFVKCHICEMSYASYFISIDIFKIKDKFIFNISCVPNNTIVSDSISQPISLSRKHSLARCLVRHNRLPNMPNHVTLINKSISGHIEA